MTEQTQPTDADLKERCAEIVEWQRTGVLHGSALRNYAGKHWAGHTDALQMAERDTSARAMELIAKWGTPAGAGEPVGEVESSLRFTGGFHARLYRDAHMPEPGTKLYTTPQPTQAQAGAVPLTEAQRNAIWEEHRYSDGDGWVVDCESIIGAVEAAHGIKGAKP
jgi:hypothetical protein